jgi:hypothetical protein
MIFGPKSCNIVGCHGANSQAPDLSVADPFTSLMGKNASSTIGSACVGMPYVTAGSPPGGVLMKRITGNTCGPTTRMPSIGDPLTHTEIDCVASWLSSKL